MANFDETVNAELAKRFLNMMDANCNEFKRERKRLLNKKKRSQQRHKKMMGYLDQRIKDLDSRIDGLQKAMALEREYAK